MLLLLPLPLPLPVASDILPMDAPYTISHNFLHTKRNYSGVS